MRNTRFGVAIMALATLLACQAKVEVTGDDAADIAAVNAVRQMEVAAITSGDTTMAYMADDIVVMPPNQPQVVGIAAARAWAAGFMTAMTVQSAVYDETTITIAGDQAIERYTASLTMTPAGAAEATTERLKGVHIYRRGADGSWKMTLDVWNSDAPVPGAM